MWLASFGYSQTISVIEGDTVVLVPIQRLKVATLLILRADSLRSEHVVLTYQYEVLKNISLNHVKLIGNKNKEIDLLTNIVKSETDKSTIYKSEIAKKNKDIKRYKRQRNIIGGAGIITIILILI